MNLSLAKISNVMFSEVDNSVKLLLRYNDSRCDLRLQKDQNEDEQGWDTTCKHKPHRESLVLSEGIDKPASFGRVGHHQTFWNH